jgi:hypothetical protein
MQNDEEDNNFSNISSDRLHAFIFWGTLIASLAIVLFTELLNFLAPLYLE